LDARFAAGAAWMKGQIIPIADAVMPVNDWGLVHSDITYDVVPVWEGGLFRFRLSGSVSRLDGGAASGPQVDPRGHPNRNHRHGGSLGVSQQLCGEGLQQGRAQNTRQSRSKAMRELFLRMVCALCVGHSTRGD